MNATSVNSWEDYDISPEVGMYADEIGLDFTTTNGLDFVCRFFDLGNPVEVLLSKEGKSPDKIDEPCTVIIHIGNRGTPRPWLQFCFKDAREAMRWMKNMPLGAAGLIP